MADAKQVVLHLSKETKGTVRFDAAEDDDMAAVGSIYVKKHTLKGERPAAIKVSLDW